jgi:putative CocE/NonD family hydrolase
MDAPSRGRIDNNEESGMPSNLIVENDVEMVTSDGVILRADVYRPEGGGRFPVLLSRTCYGKGGIPGLMMTINPLRFAREGFAVVVQDVRGRYASEGTHKPFFEARDGYEAVQWCAQQPWSNGDVGMFGSSYQAASQVQAGGSAPPALRVLAPFQASSNYGEGRVFRGGVFELGGLASVAMWNQGPGQLRRSGYAGKELHEKFNELRRALSDMPNFLAATPYESLRDTVMSAAAPQIFEWWDHDDKDDPYWQELSIESRYGNFTCPALHATSWYDAMHVGTLRNFEGIRREGATEQAREGQSLIVGPWGHYPPLASLMNAARLGPVDFGLDAVQDLETTQLNWYRRWLQGNEAAWKGRSRVRIFVMGRNQWRNEDDWPLKRARDELFYIGQKDGAGSLSSGSAGKEAIDRFTFDPANPVPTRGGAHMLLESVFPQGPLDQRDLESRDDIMVYKGEPLAEEVEVTGWVRARLWVRSSAPSTDFTAKLVDIWPDGTTINICDGIRRVTFADLPSQGGWFEVVLEMGATSNAFLPGHRIGAYISSSNFPRFDLNPNTGEKPRFATRRVPAHQEICLGGATASHLVLPIVRPE